MSIATPPEATSTEESRPVFVTECTKIEMVGGTVEMTFANVRHVECPPSPTGGTPLAHIALPVSDFHRFIGELKSYAASEEMTSPPGKRLN